MWKNVICHILGERNHSHPWSFCGFVPLCSDDIHVPWGYLGILDQRQTSLQAALMPQPFLPTRQRQRSASRFLVSIRWAPSPHQHAMPFLVNPSHLKKLHEVQEGAESRVVGALRLCVRRVRNVWGRLWWRCKSLNLSFFTFRDAKVISHHSECTRMTWQDDRLSSRWQVIHFKWWWCV